jgi:hypothetical protein
MLTRIGGGMFSVTSMLESNAPCFTESEVAHQQYPLSSLALFLVSILNFGLRSCVDFSATTEDTDTIIIVTRSSS